jgi:hypothetical protein
MIAVAKPGLARHGINRMAALLHEAPSAFDPKIFDRLRR